MDINGAILSPRSIINCLLYGDVGFGEEYVAGNIDIKSDLSEWLENNSNKSKRLLPYIRKSVKDTADHYNIPAEFYEIMLGKSMVYTCGNWDKTSNLFDAQANKYQLHSDWLELDGDQSLLECGSGLGSLSNYLKHQAREYTGLSISEEQIDYSNDHDESDRPRTRFVKTSWEDHMAFNYDRFTSICMLEHVGKDKLQHYFNWVDLCLKPKGIGTLQFISSDTLISPWADKYIFPGAYEPNLNEALRMIKNAGLRVTDLIECGEDYVPTLKAWLHNIESNIDKIKALGLDDKFIRMFKLYLSGGIVSFRSGNSQLIQLRFVKG